MTRDEIRQRIRLIADGVPLTLDNMTIQTTGTDKLLVIGWTNTIQFQNITRDKIAKELKNLKSAFSDLKKSFDELNEIVKDNRLSVEFHMTFDDSGKAGVALCSEIEGTINWYIE